MWIRSNSGRNFLGVQTKTDTFARESLVSHDVTKIQTRKLSISPRFYFHGVLGQLKTNFHTNFRFKRVLAFVIEYVRDAGFT